MGNGGTAHGSDESYESNNSDDGNGERRTPAASHKHQATAKDNRRDAESA